MATVSEQIQQIYIGLLGRAADKEGLDYWTAEIEGGILTIEQLRANIVNEQPEYAAGLGSQTRAQVVASLYENLFERAPESEGLEYWVNGGGSTVNIDQLVLALTAGASAADKLVLDNKVAAAQYYTDTSGANYNSTLAKAAVDNVDATAESVEESKELVDNELTPGNDENIHTIMDNYAPATEGTAPVTAVYWGYNPHSHDNVGTGFDNSGGPNDDDDDANEGPEDGGIPVEDLLSFLTTITGLDLTELGLIDDDGVGPFDNVTNLEIGNVTDNSGTVTISFADGSASTVEAQISDDYFAFLNDLLFDQEGNSRLYEKVIVEGTSGTSAKLIPLVLTTDVNNGGTDELETTSSADDHIVAGRTELLHQAYIDAGAGDNTLTIDMKGIYAQPKELINIQNVEIQNMANVYTDASGNNTYPELADTAGNPNSLMDLSHAWDLESLTLTEARDYNILGVDASGNPVAIDTGDLTVVGIRNGAETTLEGSFANTINLHYGANMGAGVDLVLNNVAEANGGDFVLNVAHNADTINVESTGGGNVLTSVALGGQISFLNISGDAELIILDDIAFNEGHPATIDASANTAGVDLIVTQHTDEVNFVGTEQADDHLTVAGTDGSGNATAKSVDIVGGHGNGEYDVLAAEDISIVVGDGHNEIDATSDDSGSAQEADVTVTAGGGNNDIVVSSNDLSTVNVGDGDNEIDVTAGGSSDDVATVVAGDGDNEIEAGGFAAAVVVGGGDNLIRIDSGTVAALVTTGDGNNNINADSVVASTTINTGAGNDTISAESGENAAVEVNAGDGENSIEVAGGYITVTSGAGDDTISVTGMGVSEVDQDVSGNTVEVTPADAIMINVDAGEGNNVINLAADSDTENGATGVTALYGSSISGSNITLNIGDDADLTRATLSGITAININNTDDLRVTTEQFADLGADIFSVVHWSFGATGTVTILVSEDTDASTLGLENLAHGMKAKFLIHAGATLTITAEDLDKYVADDGIALLTPTLPNSGSLMVTDAGQNFNAADDNNSAAPIGGSYDDTTNPFAGEIVIMRSVDGYEREGTPVGSDILKINSDETPVVEENIDTAAALVQVSGASDITFEGTVDLGVGGSLDFSALTGTATGLVLDNFQDITGVIADLTDDGSITGNGLTTRIDVMLAENDANNDGIADTAGLSQVGAAGNDNGLHSTGVTTYVVTDIDSDVDATGALFYVCDETQGLEVLGLQGNWDETINFLQVNWGVSFLLEGDGSVLHPNKDSGNPNYSNVGTFNADFFWGGASAEVNLNNQGTALTTRALHVEAINITNADTITVNVEDGDAVIGSINNGAVSGGTGTDDVSALVFNSANDVTLQGNLDIGDANLVGGLASLDASGVAGTFTIEVTDGTVAADLSAASLVGVEALVFADATNAPSMTLSVDQVLDIGVANISTNPGVTSTMHFAGLSNQAIDFTSIDVDDIGDITTADVDGVIVIDPATVFGNGVTTADSLTINAQSSDTTVELSVAQFNQFDTATPEVDAVAGTNAATGAKFVATMVLTDLAADSEIHLADVADTGDDVDVIVRAEGLTAGTDFVVDGKAATLEIASGDNDFTAATLTTIDGVSFTGDNASLTLTAAQVLALGFADANGDGAADAWSALAGLNVTLNIVDLSTQALDLDMIEAAGVNIGTVSIENTDAAVTIDPATTFGNADEIVTPTKEADEATEATSVSMTVAQFLSSAGIISGDAQINLTGLVNNTDTTGDFALDSAEYDLSGIANAGTIEFLGGAGNETVTLTSTADLGGFTIVLADGELIRFATESQAAADISVATGITTGVQWLFETITASVDTSGYDSDLTTLFIPEAILVNHPIEEDLWTTLANGIVVEKVNGTTIPDLVQYDRVNTFQAFSSPGDINYDIVEGFETIRDLTINVEGETTLGNLLLGDTNNGDGSTPNIDGVGFFQSLVINSYYDESSVISGGGTPGVVIATNRVGDISLNAGSVDELVTITLNTYDSTADGVLTIPGDTAGTPTADGGFFDTENVNGADAERPGLALEVGTITFGSNGTSQATLTLEGAEDITIAGVDISDADITWLFIDNNNTGTVEIGGVEYAADYHLLDNYTGTGTFSAGIIEVINGDVDLTGATTAAVTALHVSGDATITLTDSQIQAIGEGNFTVAAGVTVTLNVTEVPNGSDIDLGAIQDAGFNIGTVSTADADVALDETATLGGADQVVVTLDDNDRTFQLTAAQYEQITAGNITENDTDATTSESANVLITDLADIADAGTGEVTIDLSTVATTGTKNVQVDDAGVAADVTLADAAVLGDFTVILDSLGATLNDLAGQTIRFANAVQAERDVTVTGDAGAADNATNVIWLFTSIVGTANAGQVDTSGYDANLGRLFISETLANGANVEGLYSTLDAATIVRIFNEEDLDTILNAIVGFDREIEVESYVTIGDLTFAQDDEATQPLEFIENLTISLGGETVVGNIFVDNILDNPISNDDEFDTLTINSFLADGTGNADYLLPQDDTFGTLPGQVPYPDAANQIGNIGSGDAAEFDLGNVVINTGTAGAGGTDLIAGTITFTDDGDQLIGGTTVATLVTAGDGDITLNSLNTDDADITGLTVTHGSSGTLTVLGASPAAAVSNTEDLTINATGPVTLGTAGDADKPGVAGDELSTITANGGVIDLGVIALVDSDDFTLTGTANATQVNNVAFANVEIGDQFTVTVNGQAYTFVATAATAANVSAGLAAVIAADTNADVTVADNGGDIDLTANTTATFVDITTSTTNAGAGADTQTATLTVTTASAGVHASLEGATVGAPELNAGGTWTITNTNLNIDEDVTFNFGGTLDLTGVTLTTTGNVDLSILVDDPATTTVTEGLSITGGSIEVQAGSTLTLTAEQADGLTITGAGTVEVTGLEDFPAADLGGIMTGTGDTGNVNVAIDTSDADGDTNPEDIVLTNDLGIAHLTIAGDGSVDVTGATVALVDRQDPATGADTSDDDAPSFTVGTDATLTIDATQVGNATGDPLTSSSILADGAGTVDVTNLNANADADLSGLTATTVTANVAASVTFTGDLGTAAVTVPTGVDLQAAGSVLTGQTISGAGTVSVDDENDGGLPDTAVDADLSNVSTDFIEFVADATVGTITFPTLTEADAVAVPPILDQTVTLTSVQANGQTIVGANAGAGGIVLVNIDDTVDAEPDGDVDAFDLSGINAGTMTATINDAVDDDVVLDAAVDLGDFDLVITAGDTVTMTGAQADARTITETGAATLNLTDVTAGQDFTGITVTTVAVVVSDGATADLSAVTGITVIDVDPAPGAAAGNDADLTINAAQFGALGTVVGGTNNLAADLAELDVLTVDVEYDFSGTPIDVDLTVDADTASLTFGQITGNAAGFVQARVDDDADTNLFTAFLDNTTVPAYITEIVHTGLGSLVVADSGAAGVAGVADTFTYEATPSLTFESTVTVFDTADGDKIDLSAFGDADNTVTVYATGGGGSPEVMVDNEVYFLSTAGAAGEADDNQAAAVTLIDGIPGTTWTETAGFEAYFVINDDNSAAIYKYVAVAADNAITTDELHLIGTVDDVLLSTDIIA